MKAIFAATASCSPTGRPHCTASVDHSRAIFEAPLAGAGAHGGQRQPPGVQGGQGDLQAWPSRPIRFVGGHADLVEPGHAVLDAAQAHEGVAVLDGDARESASTTNAEMPPLCPSPLGHPRHHDEQVGDHAVGGPQLDAVEHVGRSRPRSEPRSCRSRAGSEPTSGSVSRNALISLRAQRGRNLRFCSAVPNSFSGSARRSTGAPTAARRAPGWPSRPASAPGCSRRWIRPEPAVLLGDLHPEGADLLQPVDDLVGDAGLAFDEQAVDLSRRTPRSRRGTPRPCAACSSVRPRMRMNQVQPEVVPGTAPWRSWACATRSRGPPRQPRERHAR